MKGEDLKPVLLSELLNTNCFSEFQAELAENPYLMLNVSQFLPEKSAQIPL